MENVNHPKHYNKSAIECIDAIESAIVGKTGIDAFCIGNAIKYMWRCEEKGGIEDLKKAKWYLDRLIEKTDTKVVDEKTDTKVQNNPKMKSFN